mgnify:CR=1 FL=1
MLLSDESFSFEGSDNDNSSGISLEEAYYLGLEVFSYRFQQLKESEKKAFIRRLDSIK